jgi:hypothetical protein
MSLGVIFCGAAGNVISARVGVERESGRNRGFGYVFSILMRVSDYTGYCV